MKAELQKPIVTEMTKGYAGSILEFFNTRPEIEEKDKNILVLNSLVAIMQSYLFHLGYRTHDLDMLWNKFLKPQMENPWKKLEIEQTMKKLS